MSRKANPNTAKYSEAIVRVLQGMPVEQVRTISAKDVCDSARKYLPNDLRASFDPGKNRSISVLVSIAKRPITGGHGRRGRPSLKVAEPVAAIADAVADAATNP